ncbi:MAG: ComEC/Rec2 family competence protein [Candidatus Omnitrophota bacterium]
MKKPLVWLAIVFSFGIIAASRLKIGQGWLYLSAFVLLLLSLFLFKRNVLWVILLSVLVFICGMIWLNNYTMLPQGHISRFYYKSGKVYSLKGWVDSVPNYGNNQTSFLFQCEEIAEENKKQTCRGKILVIVRGALKTEYGQELILEARLNRPFGEYLRRQGVSLIGRVKTPCFVQWTGKIKGWIVTRSVSKLKSRIEEMFESSLSPICAGIIEAMTLGEERNVPAIIYKNMIKSGTVHILVVSGSNVGVVCFIIILLLKITRIKRRLRFFLCVPLLLIYCLLTGASNPVVRATIMAIVFLFAYLIKRQADIYNSCAVSALIILIMNPAQVFNIGFQLSFASVLAIAFFYPRFKNWLKLDLIKTRILRLPLEGCLVSLSAWLGTAGLIAFYFRLVSPITVLANLFIVPLASLITLCGFSLLVIQSLSSCLARSFIPVNEFLVNLLLQGNGFLLQFPFAYFYLP